MREENGFSLIAAIAAIAIPNLIQTRMAANHSSAAASMPCRLHANDGHCREHILPHTPKFPQVYALDLLSLVPRRSRVAVGDCGCVCGHTRPKPRD